MESEKRAKRPRIGMSNREGATERYEKVEYRRNGGEEGHSSYSANAERPYYPRNNYGDGGNRSYGNERPNNYGNRQGGYSNNRQGNYGNNRRNNNYNNTPRYNQDYNRNNEVERGFSSLTGKVRDLVIRSKTIARADIITGGIIIVEDIIRIASNRVGIIRCSAARSASNMSCRRWIRMNRFV